MVEAGDQADSHESTSPGRDGSGLEAVLDYLREARLFDFTGYKRGTLTRRLDKRMEHVGIADHRSYIDYLEVHPEEFEQLFNTVLINVTSFFRDPETWQLIEHGAIPDILTERGDGPIRVWSAGCATGQEAYSALMLFAERLGVEATKQQVKVYATDLDSDALARARTAVFSEREMEGLSDHLRQRYFQPVNAHYEFDAELRRSVIFGRHDLLHDAPISRTDLLLCRNTLMYFNADVQARLIHRLHFSVADRGYLVLGKVEMLNQPELFQAADQRHRLFHKVNQSSLRARLLTMVGVGSDDAPEDARLLDVAFEHRANPEVLLDGTGVVLAVNARARTLFGVGRDAVGRPFQDLELSYRPAELRSRIDEVRADGRVVELDEVPRWGPSGELTFLDIKLAPLGSGGEHLGVVITFVDVTRHRQLQEELEQTHRELEVAYEEVQSANEELETTNEELQSSVEELETTNEELQSTNEELETTNEELSSVNEELETINDELRERTAQANKLNAYLESVLVGLDASVIVVDTDLTVRVWNGLSFDMWGLRTEEVEGRSILGLNIGFPVDTLGPGIGSCLKGQPVPPIVTPAVTRLGASIVCSVTMVPLLGPGRVIEGAIILIRKEPDRPSDQAG